MLDNPSIALQLFSQEGWSSLMFASCNGHVEVVDKLLQHGARVDLQNKVNQKSNIISISVVLCQNILQG